MSMPSSLIVFHFTALSPMSTLQWYLRAEQRLSTEQRAAEHAKAEHARDVLPLVEPDLQLHALEVHAGGGRRMDAPGRARPPERGAAQPRRQHGGARGALNGAELGEFGSASRLCGQHPR